jgi:hypothetical protein
MAAGLVGFGQVRGHFPLVRSRSYHLGREPENAARPGPVMVTPRRFA